MNHMPSMDLSEYNERTTGEITKLRKLVKDCFLAAIALAVAGVVALSYDSPIVAVVLFTGFLILELWALTARLEISMIESNWWLALLINRQASGLEAIQCEFQKFRQSNS